jgi:hypothetical protein
MGGERGGEVSQIISKKSSTWSNGDVPNYQFKKLLVNRNSKERTFKTVTRFFHFLRKENTVFPQIFL